MNRPKFLILLSSYNGENYIAQQLESLLNQEEVLLHIFIRDDGSTDSTVSLINEFMVKFPSLISFYKEENLGAKQSFFELIKLASHHEKSYDYFAFCDQDDVWDKGKLQQAAKVLTRENNEIPLMYCSTTQMVDSHLSKINIWPSSPKKDLSMYNALVENVAVGCTTVLNQRALQFLVSNFPSNLQNIIMHDWWAYLCISTFGTVVFDELPSILYRQHSNNALGGQTDNIFNKWRKRFQRYFKGQNQYIISKQAREFFKVLQHLMDEKTKRDVEQFLTKIKSPVFSRIIYTLHTPFYRQSMGDQYIMKLIIVLGKI